jgi:hypothetical protein
VASAYYPAHSLLSWKFLNYNLFASGIFAINSVQIYDCWVLINNPNKIYSQGRFWIRERLGLGEHSPSASLCPLFGQHSGPRIRELQEPDPYSGSRWAVRIRAVPVSGEALADSDYVSKKIAPPFPLQREEWKGNWIYTWSTINACSCNSLNTKSILRKFRIVGNNILR